MSVTSATIGTTSPASGGTLTSSNAGTANTGLASSNSGTRQVRFQWGSDQTLTLPATVTFAINNIQNPTTAGTFYARIGFFGNGDTTYTTVTDKGVVANSVQATQNVTFKVQETLAFCVGAMPNATVAHGGFAAASLTVDCAQSAGTNIALGIAPDATTGCVTPVSVRSATCEDPSTTDDDNYGYAMVRTTELVVREEATLEKRAYLIHGSFFTMGPRGPKGGFPSAGQNYQVPVMSRATTGKGPSAPPGPPVYFLTHEADYV
jgi:hypothetical protein